MRLLKFLAALAVVFGVLTQSAFAQSAPVVTWQPDNNAVIVGKVGEQLTVDFDATLTPNDDFTVNYSEPFPRFIELFFPGLTLDAQTGVLSGIPSRRIISSFPVKATFSKGQGDNRQSIFATQPYDFNIGPSSPLTAIDLTDTVTANATVRQPYTHDFDATGGDGLTYYFEIVGTLPAALSGMVIDSETGVIRVTSAEEGTFSFDVKVADKFDPDFNKTETINLTVNPGPPVATMLPAPNQVIIDGKVGDSFNVDIEATLTPNNGFTVVYALTGGGVLPAGLTLDTANGNITGIPTVRGQTGFNVLATFTKAGNEQSYSIEQLYFLNVRRAVEPPPVKLTNLVLAAAFINKPFSHDFDATGGESGRYRFDKYNIANLPAALSSLTIDSQTGVITVTPTATGTFAFDISVYEEGEGTGGDTQTLTLNVDELPAVLLTDFTLTDGKVGEAFTHDFNAIGGNGSTYRFSINGALPEGLSGLTINQQTGVINVTPAASGTLTFGVKVIDANNAGNFDVKTISLVIVGLPAVQLTNLVLGDGTVGTAYTHDFNATGGDNTNYRFAINGALPSGLSGLTINQQTGIINFTPTVVGSFDFGVKVSDANDSANFDLKTLTLIIEAVPEIAYSYAMTPTNRTLPSSTQGFAYSATFVGTRNPFVVRPAENTLLSNAAALPPETATSYVIETGNLPNGLTLSTGGVLSGTPTVSGSFDFSVKGIFNQSPTEAAPGTMISDYTLIVDVFNGPPVESQEIADIQTSGSSASAVISSELITETVGDAANDALSDALGSSPLVGYSNGAMIIVSKAKMTPAVKAIDELKVADRKAMRLRAGGSVPGLFAAYGEDGAVVSDGVDPARWSVWASVRGTQLETGSSLNNLDGTQYNLLSGVSYRWSPEMVIGAFGGYETFKFADDVGAKLAGDGYTAGTYIGYRPNSGLRFDGQLSTTLIDYKASSGAVTGNFDAKRVIASGAVTGSYAASGFMFEPSVRFTGTWEQQSAYVDSASTAHAARSFSFGKVSTGVKVSKSFAMGEDSTITPFAGLFADYRFTSGTGSTSDNAFDGLSARATAGIGAKLNQSTNLALNGEVSGLGLNDALLWSLKMQLGIQF